MTRIFIIFMICTVLHFSQCLPTSDPWITITDNDSSTVTSTTPEMTTVNKEQLKPELYSMRVNTDVHYRYATTVVSSRVANPANYSQEVVFSIVIPETAFISAFLMEIDGKVYKAYVKEKKAAKQDYDAAVQSGIGAAHVAVSARDSNRFTVNVNVEALSKATFNLTYEELLTRRLEVYNLVINLHLRQLVRDLSVDVNIVENSKINVLRTPTLRSGNEVDADEKTESNPFAKIEFKNDKKTEAHVSFTPTTDQQKQLIKMNDKKNKETENKDGLHGQFVVQYDVEREPQGGEVMIYDGYFVHFFAPSDLKPLNKYVIFVLDVSGSMIGRKIIQLREAMLAILDDLKEGDYFNIIEFSFGVKVWNLDDPMKSYEYQSVTNWYGEPVKVPTEPIQILPYAATTENIKKANNLIKNLDANGGTNIYDALKMALNVSKSGMDTLLANKTEKTALPEPLIIFLTDGDPTVAETNPKKIISMVSEFNFGDKKTAIFSLAFGEDADRGFLKQLALRNSGFMRHIYEAADSAVQLQHFYKQISSPLLTDVKFKYPADQIEEASITEHGFPILFSGTELVVAGRIATDKKDILPQVSGYSIRGPIDFIPKIIPVSPPEKQNKPSLERLWAYLTIKQLLDEKDAHIDPESGPVLTPTTETSEKKKETPETKALQLAMKYSFVTSLTSLVVVKPNATSAVDTEAAKEHNNYAALPLHAGGLMGASVNRFQSSGAFYHAAPLGLAAPSAPVYDSFYDPLPGSPVDRIDTDLDDYATDRIMHKVMPARPQFSTAFGGGAPGFSSASGFSGAAGPHFALAGPPPALAYPAYITTTRRPPPPTTHIPRPPPPTIRPMLPPTTEVIKMVDLATFGLEQLTWLQDYTVQPDSIQIPNGVYKLGVLKNITDFSSCKLPENKNGTCVFLPSCTEVFPQLNSLDSYIPMFCHILDYAGICCPEENKKI